jgi:hypothetical protein
MCFRIPGLFLVRIGRMRADLESGRGDFLYQFRLFAKSPHMILAEEVKPISEEPQVVKGL